MCAGSLDDTSGNIARRSICGVDNYTDVRVKGACQPEPVLDVLLEQAMGVDLPADAVVLGTGQLISAQDGAL